jgi:hypothetical protein
MSNESAGTKEEVVSLSDFAKDNKDLLTAFNILIAVTAFAANLLSGLPGTLLAFFTLTAALFAGLELCRLMFAVERPAKLLLGFVASMALAVSILTIFSLVQFRDIWSKLGAVIAVGVTFVIIDILKERVSDPVTRTRLLVALLIIFGLVAWYFGPPDFSRVPPTQILK